MWSISQDNNCKCYFGRDELTPKTASWLLIIPHYLSKDGNDRNLTKTINGIEFTFCRSIELLIIFNSVGTEQLYEQKFTKTVKMIPSYRLFILVYVLLNIKISKYWFEIPQKNMFLLIYHRGQYRPEPFYLSFSIKRVINMVSFQ